MGVVARKWEFCAAEVTFCKFYYTPCLAFKFEEVKKSTLQRLSGTDAKDGENEGKKLKHDFVSFNTGAIKGNLNNGLYNDAILNNHNIL